MTEDSRPYYGIGVIKYNTGIEMKTSSSSARKSDILVLLEQELAKQGGDIGLHALLTHCLAMDVLESSVSSLTPKSKSTELGKVKMCWNACEIFEFIK